MGIINVLDFSVANLIAAGEVVDRPASVIKELLENSIDAGADSITVEIKRGGITFMRVTDNGKGMDKDDMPVAIKRHATSKIRTSTDLDSILTLGFRGEALAAIASVSKLRIMSKTKDSSVGHILEAEAGEVKSLSEAGCPDGTTVIVENLFANVPARLKFLKKDATEAMAESAYVEKIALSRPDISIKLIIDGQMKFMTGGDSKLYSVIYILFGKDFAKRMIPVENKSEGIKVWGYVGTPDNIRANRNFQNFFINGRFVKSKTVSAALEQAYSAFIPADKFPSAIMNIDINPAFVDVNVHPAKLEVKFSNERLIFESVYSTVRQALENKITRPELVFGNNSVSVSPVDYTKKINPFVPINDGKRDEREQLTFNRETHIPDKAPVVISRTEEVKTETKTQIPQTAQKQESEFVAVDIFEPGNNEKIVTVSPFEADFVSKIPAVPENKDREDIPKTVYKTAEESKEDETVIPEYRIIGEAFFSYVFVETGESVLIIDKHAAHERIIFEELKNNLKKKEIISQIMLVPVDIVLTNEEGAAIGEYAEEIRKMGFEFELYGNTISVSEAPIELSDNGIVPMIQTIADRLANGTGNVTV